MKLPDLEPITNKPAVCAHCGKSLPVRWVRKDVVDVGGWREYRRVGYINAVRRYDPFCTLRCGFEHGRAWAKAQRQGWQP